MLVIFPFSLPSPTYKLRYRSETTNRIMDMPRMMLGPASRSTHCQSSLSTHTHTKGLVVTGYLTQMQINYSAVFTHLTTLKNTDYPGQIRKPVIPLVTSSVPDSRDAFRDQPERT